MILPVHSIFITINSTQYSVFIKYSKVVLKFVTACCV